MSGEAEAMNRKQRRKHRKGPGNVKLAVYSLTMDEMGTKGAEIMREHPRAIMINVSAQLRKLYAALDEIKKEEDEERSR